MIGCYGQQLHFIFKMWAQYGGQTLNGSNLVLCPSNSERNLIFIDKIKTNIYCILFLRENTTLSLLLHIILQGCNPGCHSIHVYLLLTQTGGTILWGVLSYFEVTEGH